MSFRRHASTPTSWSTRSDRYARTGSYPRVLVSAAADYSMLAHLRCAFDAERAPLDATVADSCDTALFLNSWYAVRYDMKATTVLTNILDYAPDRRFDLVCTHNFLSRFDPASRRRLVARWHALLRTGGVVLTTQRIMPNHSGGEHLYSDAEARVLQARIAAAARAYPQPLGVDHEDLALAAYQYAVQARIHVIRTMGDITDLFEAEGFEVVFADAGEGTTAQTRDRTTCRGGGGAYRMRLVARTR